MKENCSKSCPETTFYRDAKDPREYEGFCRTPRQRSVDGASIYAVKMASNFETPRPQYKSVNYLKAVVEYGIIKSGKYMVMQKCR